MKQRTLLLAAAMSLMVAIGSFAALSSTYVDWAKGPVQFLMSSDEMKAWKSAQTDDQAQSFIDLFWARRDPTPGTPRNEFKDEFEARTKYADDNFSTARAKGSMTDRGKIFLLFGPPSRPVQKSNAAQEGTIRPAPTFAPSNDESMSPRQLWIYDISKSPELKKINVPLAEFGFVDQYGTNQWTLERTPRTDVNGLIQKIVQADIVSPNLAALPKAPAPKAAAAPAAPAAPAPMTAFKTEAFKTAVGEYLAAKASPYKNLYLTWGEFVTPDGQYFVPVSLYVPKAAGLTAESDLTFFGAVEDSTGKAVSVFEEPGKLAVSSGDFYYDRSLTLPSGKYRGVFGIAQGGKPLAMAGTDFDLAVLDKSAAGISRLMLSNNVYPLSQAQSPTDPFAFGGIKVIPKGDLEFHKTDDLWYFIELRNPGLDEATKAPKVQLKTDVEGTTDAKKPVRMSAPLSEADIQPLKGVEGHYGVGSAIPLATFAPGSYSIKLKVIDTVSKVTYNLQQDFRVVADSSKASK